MIQGYYGYYLLLAVNINSEGFGCTFDNLVRTMVWLLQSPAYCILSYKDIGAMGQIAPHEKSLSRDDRLELLAVASSFP